MTKGGTLCPAFLPKEKGPCAAWHRVRLVCPSLDRAGNFTGTQTPGTNVHMARRTIDHSLHALDIGLPGTIGASVGVGNLDTEGHALIAELALCYPLHLLAVRNSLAYTASNRYLSRLQGEMQALFDKKTKKIQTASWVLRKRGIYDIITYKYKYMQARTGKAGWRTCIWRK